MGYSRRILFYHLGLMAALLVGCGSGGGGGSSQGGMGGEVAREEGSAVAKASHTQDEERGELFYLAEGKKVYLKPSTREIAVRLRGGMDIDQTIRSLRQTPSLAPLRDSHRKARAIGKTGFHLLELEPEVSGKEMVSLLEEVASTSLADFVSPVFEFRGTRMILSDEIILKFKDQTPGAEIDRAISPHEVLKRGHLGKNSFLIRIRTSSGVQALQVANEFCSHPWVEYCQPNFLRLLRRTPLVPTTPEENIKSQEGALDFLKRNPARKVLEQNVSGSSLGIGPLATGPPTWTPNLGEGFEGAFPGATWSLQGNPTWGKTGYLKDTGNYSVWCARGGASGKDPATSDYANDMNASMIYGSFSLSDATYGQLRFRYWLHSQSGVDEFFCGLSTDGMNFFGYTFSGGSAAWRSEMENLTDVFPLGDLTGQSNVWVMFSFTSDGSVTDKGAFVDNVAVLEAKGQSSISNDTWSARQWALNNVGQTGGRSGADISANEAWQLTMGDPSIIVALIDEGVDLVHEDLSLVPGYDATGGGSDGGCNGEDAHGTNCAGLIAGIANNGKGIAGVAPQVKIMSVRIAFGDGMGNWITSDDWIADGIRWAADHGGRILNNSWGGGGSSSAITSAIRYARNTKGATLLFAAGNDNGPVDYPATLPEVIAVAATSPCDERKSPASCDGEYWWGSNYGPEIDIAAPGVLHYSTDISGAMGYSSGNYFSHFNGTSAACAVASGVAALILSLNPALSPAGVKSILQSSADDLGAPGFDNAFGYGRVNAFQALSVPSPPSHLSASVLSASQIDLSWQDNSSNEVGFKIERKAGGRGTFHQIATATAQVCTFSDKGLSPSTTYSYRVRAYGIGDSAYSNEAHAITPASLGGEGRGGGDGDCFIASAAYGSHLAPEVVVLRGFRDKFLSRNALGRSLVAFYYRTSPPLASFISRHEGWRLFSRFALTPVVYGLKYPRSAVLCLFLVIFMGVIGRRRKSREGLF